MIPFKLYLIEDKDRFIDKSPFLNRTQKETIKDFFKANRQAEKDKDIDWNKFSSYDWDYLQGVMMKYKSGRKIVLTHKGLSGLKEGEDYIHVKLKTKEYLAYIPMNYEVAQQFNTRKLGPCQGSWCVGHSSTDRYWKDHIISQKEIPVYILNKESKWIVMVQKDNHNFDIWDIDNLRPQPHDSIPDFDVKKELFTPGLISMYKELRQNRFGKKIMDKEEAIHSYKRLVRDIENAKDNYEYYLGEWKEECQQIKDRTKENYEEEYKEWEDQYENQYENLKKEADWALKEFRSYLKDPANYKVVNTHKQQMMFPEQYYISAKERYNAVDKKHKELLSILDKIDKIEYYDMHDDHYFNKDIGIKWEDAPPSEPEPEGLYLRDSSYEEYFNYSDFDMDDSEYDLAEKIVEYVRGYSGYSTAEKLLSWFVLNNPEEE